MRIDHLIREDYACSPLLTDFVNELDDESGVDSLARDSDPSNFFYCFTHAMVNARCRGSPRSLLQADTITVSSGLANLEQSSWSTLRCHKFWDLTMNRKHRQTMTSLSTGLKTTVLEGGMLVQYG